MRSPARTAALSLGWLVLLVVPWLYYVVRGWEFEADCDLVERVPAGFGLLVTFAAAASLPLAVLVARRERGVVRGLAFVAIALSVVLAITGFVLFASVGGSTVDCGGPPHPAST